MKTKFEDFIKESKDNQYVYHYTSLENAIDIIKDGQLKIRERSIINRYSNLEIYKNDYGYISFTENEEFDSSDISCDLRFIFKKKTLENHYNLIPFSFDEEKVKSLEYDNDQELSDLDYANEEWFGDEEEIRVYENVSLEFLDSIEMIEEYASDELIKICDDKNIKLIKNL